MGNEKILNKIWSYKKKGQVHTDIKCLCKKITDGIIKYCAEEKISDNYSIIFIAFKNFEDKMRDPDFEYKALTKCLTIKDKYDLGLVTY